MVIVSLHLFGVFSESPLLDEHQEILLSHRVFNRVANGWKCKIYLKIAKGVILIKKVPVAVA